MLRVTSVCTPCCMLLRAVGSWCAKFKPVKRATCKRTQQLLRPSVEGFKELWGMYNPGQKVLGHNPFLTCFWMEFAANGLYLLINAAGGGGGRGRGQLEMHFLHLKHSVTNILTRTVVNCYILLLHTAYHVERAPMKKPLFNKLSGPCMVQSFRPSIVSVQ